MASFFSWFYQNESKEDKKLVGVDIRANARAYQSAKNYPIGTAFYSQANQNLIIEKALSGKGEKAKQYIDDSQLQRMMRDTYSAQVLCDMAESKVDFDKHLILLNAACVIKLQIYIDGQLKKSASYMEFLRQPNPAPRMNRNPYYAFDSIHDKTIERIHNG